jgi:6-phospho-beta-glucosidase
MLRISDGRLDAILEGRLFGGAGLRALGMIPNEYLYFYEFGTETVAALRNGTESRSSFLVRQQRAFYDAAPGSPEAALAAWRVTRSEREETYFAEARSAAGVVADGLAADGGGYEGVAMDVVEAIACDERRVLILNTANHGALPFFDEHAVVEVPSLVGRAGVSPLAVGAVPTEARLLLETVKEVERLTIAAARTRSRDLAIRALALHPLVPSMPVAVRIFDAYAAGQPELGAWAR